MLLAVDELDLLLAVERDARSQYLQILCVTSLALLIRKTADVESRLANQVFARHTERFFVCAIASNEPRLWVLVGDQRRQVFEQRQLETHLPPQRLLGGAAPGNLSMKAAVPDQDHQDDRDERATDRNGDARHRPPVDPQPGDADPSLADGIVLLLADRGDAVVEKTGQFRVVLVDRETDVGDRQPAGAADLQIAHCLAVDDIGR
jgi:hypothetical protein